jgi:iron complex outermembrane receptor protein
MKRVALCCIFSAAIVILTAQAARAQTAPAPAAPVPTGTLTGKGGTAPANASPSSQEMAPIIVTGSAIPTTDTEGASPVTVIDSSTIKQRGYQSLNDIIRNLPQEGGVNDPGLDANGFTPGASYISLRGLGPQATLILINGRRVANYPGLGNGQYPFVDVNGIPVQVIDHVEVLTEGTALYGSDAIAGVVNIITKKSLPEDENGEFDTFLGNTTHKDAFLQRYSLMGNLGTFDKQGFGIIEADYSHQDSISAVDRVISSSANQAPNGGFDLRSGRTYPGTFFGETDGNEFTINNGTRNVPLTGTTPGTDPNVSAGFGPPYDYNPDTTVAPDTTYYGIYTDYSYKFYDGNITPNIDFQYRHNRSIQQSAPDGYSIFDGDSGPSLTSPALGGLAFIVPTTNPYNLTGEPIDILTYRFVPLGPRIEQVDSEYFRAVPSIDFKLGDGWTLNLAMNYGYNFLNDRGVNFVDANQFQAALDSTNPATAYNPFTSTGFQTPAALNSIRAEDDQKGTYSLIGEQFQLNGSVYNLPAGPIQTAFGGEYRFERFNQTYSNDEVSGGIISQAQQADTAASRKILSGYTEVDFPITSPSFNCPGFYQMDVIADGRVDKYTDFGSTENPQIRLRWETIPGLVLRFSYAKAFRAPSLNELAAGGNGSYVFVDNPKYVNPVTGSTIAQVLQVTPGNPDLKPETAETFSFGVAYTPEAVKGLLLTADYFKIRYTGQIQNQDAQTLVDNNSPQVHLVPGSTAISFIDVNYANLNNSYVEGFDWGARYVLGDPNTNWGQLTLNIGATYYRKYIQDDGTGAADYVGTDSGGLGSFSRYRQDADITWGYRNFSLTVSNDYTSGYSDNVADEDGLTTPRNVAAWFVWDLNASYTFDKQTVEHDIAPGPISDGFDWRKILEGTTLTVGCNNIVDEAPPFSADPNDTLGYDQSYADGTGRFVYGELTKKF